MVRTVELLGKRVGADAAVCFLCVLLVFFFFHFHNTMV